MPRIRPIFGALISNLQALDAFGGRFEHAARLHQYGRNLCSRNAHSENQYGRQKVLHCVLSLRVFNAGCALVTEHYALDII